MSGIFYHVAILHEEKQRMLGLHIFVSLYVLQFDLYKERTCMYNNY